LLAGGIHSFEFIGISFHHVGFPLISFVTGIRILFVIFMNGRSISVSDTVHIQRQFVSRNPLSSAVRQGYPIQFL